MPAIRNTALCTKDCLCLYVCPTGATDTETGQIDPDKCLDGCRACVDACPSHAITLVPRIYPPPQAKSKEVIEALLSLAESKVQQEQTALSIKKDARTDFEKNIAQSLASSSRLMAEDFIREAGFMLPQGNGVRQLLKELLQKEQPEGFPVEAVESLLKSL